MFKLSPFSKVRKENFKNGISCGEIKKTFEAGCMPYAYPPNIGEICDRIYPDYLKCTSRS